MTNESTQDLAAAWAETPATAAGSAVLDQLELELPSLVAVCVVTSRVREVLLHRSKFEALTGPLLGETLYQLAGTALEATESMGGIELFGDVVDGLVVTESAAVHYRLLADDRAVIMLTDRPEQTSHLEIARRVLAAYDQLFDRAIAG